MQFHLRLLLLLASLLIIIELSVVFIIQELPPVDIIYRDYEYDVKSGAVQSVLIYKTFLIILKLYV